MIDADQSRRIRRLSELARRVIRAAEWWAHHSAMPDAQIDAHLAPHSGHLLLALVLETRSVSSVLLGEVGIDSARARAALNAHTFHAETGINGVLDEAFAHADRLGNHYTGTEHLLLALTTDAAAAARLSTAEIDLAHLQARVERYLTR
ncbi:MAG: Clp protease N-terminal domain-containing protein [Chloroflexota bacterium]|nr:Clp protease N-terminal domain-containing protein [Chloroflexota bacterium]